jgi:serine/threonine protein kinase
VQREIEILKRIDHPHCVKLFDVFDSANQVYLVMELMTGGELFDRIIEKVSLEKFRIDRPVKRKRSIT